MTKGLFFRYSKPLLFWTTSGEIWSELVTVRRIVYHHLMTHNSEPAMKLLKIILVRRMFSALFSYHLLAHLFNVRDTIGYPN